MNFKTIGILGGGQLGRMLTFAAKRLGMTVAILDPDSNAPAGQVADRQIVGDFRNAARIRELAEGCDLLTVEIEHVDTEMLETLENVGVQIQPPAATIRLIQDKYAQKEHLAAHGIPVAPFRDAPNLEAVHAAIAELGLPLMLKSRRMAYDGRGNAVIRSADDIEAALAKLGTRELYAEQWASFDKELAVMVARGLDGELSVYPVVETIHKDNICHTVIAPAQIPVSVQHAAQQTARQAISTLSGAGIFGVEMFLLSDGKVCINEIAPRPHNSGHYTLEACYTDQYEQHVRAILGLPLGDPSLKVGAAVMVNVLGTGDDAWEATTQPLDTALKTPGAGVHWYGKSAVRAQRKMGHITVVGDSMADLAPRVKAIAEVQLQPAPLVGVIMGSDSDLPTMKQAAAILRDFDVPFELTIVSAHRTPQRMVDYARSAHERGLQVIIAAAGGAAHLPGMIAALTPLPVIGVPIKSEPLSGQDALYSIVQMPRGVPVATVAIGNATNAGLLAVRILAASNPPLLRKMIAYQEAMESSVMEKVDVLARDGWEKYGE
jgi:phosphoribosylaminoimidazole carboxylase